MPLTDTGQTVDALEGVNALALDQNGNSVTITTTFAAIADFGWGVIIPMAGCKFDDGELAAEGPPPVVRVTTADCERWMNDNA